MRGGIKKSSENCVITRKIRWDKIDKDKYENNVKSYLENLTTEIDSFVDITKTLDNLNNILVKSADDAAPKINQRLSRACIVHLVIKKNNWSYVKTMSCSGSHLGITINIKNTKFVKDLPMIDAQFRFNQCNSFREEYISVFSPLLIL